mgnify:CR=1 FL=1
MAYDNLIVQFQPNGDQEVYPEQVTPSATAGTNPTNNSPVTSTSQFGGTQTGGYFGWYSAPTGKGYLYWLPVGNGVHRIWQMDSYAAARLAVSNITSALVDVGGSSTGGTGYVLVNTAGAIVNTGS